MRPVSVAAHQINSTAAHALGKRKAMRRLVTIPAEISMGDRARRLTCTIVDISATGARLRINLHSAKVGNINELVQQRIGLYFDQPCTSVECDIKWKSDKEVGVQFCSAFQRTRRVL